MAQAVAMVLGGCYGVGGGGGAGGGCGRGGFAEPPFYRIDVCGTEDTTCHQMCLFWFSSIVGHEASISGNKVCDLHSGNDPHKLPQNQTIEQH